MIRVPLLLALPVFLALSSGCSMLPGSRPATPAEILADAEVVFTGDCPKGWGGGDNVCTAWKAPSGTRYISVHGPDGEPIMILIRGEDGAFKVEWEAKADG